MTVIRIPKSKRRKEESNKLLPFSKLHPNDKSRIILECLSSQLATAQALSGKRLLNEEDVKCNIHLIMDTIRDTQNVDVHRFQKYFTSKGWLAVLSVLKEKENSEWFCPICDKVTSSTQNSIMVSFFLYNANQNAEMSQLVLQGLQSQVSVRQIAITFSFTVELRYH